MARKTAKTPPDPAAPPAPKARPKSTRKAAPKAAGAKAAPSTRKPRTAAAEANGRPTSGRSLVIVESPKKATSIGKFLGSRFVVKASMGHVRDLPEKGNDLGIDVAGGYVPTYVVPDSKKSTIGELKREAAKADVVYLATDPDREGEAIAWHLQQALDLPDDRVLRVMFHEITERAVKEAFDHVGPIDMNKVNAQQARRFLDRFVGWQLSPLLRKKITMRMRLSAGRVQSVAVRLIADREREIRAFRSEEYWKITATVAPAGSAAEADAFAAELVEWRGAKFGADNEADAHAVRDALGGERYRVARLETAERLDKADAPFKTSTLQQQATIRLRLSGERAMRIAQELYEGIDVDGSGPVGLITYMRTDSLRVSDEAVTAVRDHIETRYGRKYLPEKPIRYAAGKLAQEAHEAIRPTELKLHPDAIKDRLTHDQHRLYSLIYRRFVASQMAPALFEVTDVEIEAGAGRFRTQGKILRFDGYRRVLAPAGKQEDRLLPPLAVGQALDLRELAASQHFTQPPPRYSEATLIKALEKENIGRPSTYAPIIKVVQDRGYVEQKERRFHGTELGLAITDFLVSRFPKIMDVKFTAHMEDELDDIVTGKEQMGRVLDEFYYPFQESLQEASGQPGYHEITIGEDCPECGSPLHLKFSKNGPFAGCSRYPDCSFTKPVGGESSQPAVETEHTCPGCGKPLKIKQGKRGPFLYCSGYPACKRIFDVGEDGRPKERNAPQATEHPCPRCGKPMILRQSSRGPFLGCSGYPKCRGTVPVDDQGKPAATVTVDVKCEKCGGPMGVKSGRRGAFLGCLNYPRCRSTAPIPEELKDQLAAAAPAAPAGPDLKSIVVEETCENCGGPMLVRRGRRGYFLGCAAYPKCKGTKEPGPATLEKILAVAGQ